MPLSNIRENVYVSKRRLVMMLMSSRQWFSGTWLSLWNTENKLKFLFWLRCNGTWSFLRFLNLVSYHFYISPSLIPLSGRNDNKTKTHKLAHYVNWDSFHLRPSLIDINTVNSGFTLICLGCGGETHSGKLLIWSPDMLASAGDHGPLSLHLVVRSLLSEVSLSWALVFSCPLSLWEPITEHLQ